MRRRLKRLLRERRSTVLYALFALFLLLDAGLAYYNVTSATAMVESTKDQLPFDLIDLQTSLSGMELYLTSTGVYVPTRSGYSQLNVAGTAKEIALGHASDSAAVLTTDGKVQFFPAGASNPDFTVALDSNLTLIGIMEMYGPMRYAPMVVSVLKHNDSGDHLLTLSVAQGGKIDFTYNFEANVTSFSHSSTATMMAFGMDNGKTIMFRTSDRKITTSISRPGSVVDVKVSRDGTHLAVLSQGQNWTLAGYGSWDASPWTQFNVQPNAHDLRVRDGGMRLLYRLDDSIYEAVGLGTPQRVLDHPGMLDYVPPEVGDVVIVAAPGDIVAYAPGRVNPVWSSSTGISPAGITSDIVGTMVNAWNGSRLVRIDVSAGAAGSGVIWVILGFMIIGEGVVLALVAWEKRIRRLGFGLLYTGMIGVLAGAATAAIFQDAAAIAWFGSELAYLGIAAAVGTVGCVLSWNAQAGPLGLVLGAAGGLISSVPISIVAAFFLWSYGYSFPGQDPIIGSALNVIGTGFWAGLFGGGAGWVATRFVK